MKKLLIIITVLLLFTAACGNNDSKSEDSSSEETKNFKQDNGKTIKIPKIQRELLYYILLTSEL